MLRIKPFAAVRPLPNVAAQVSSPPYDVVTTEEARQLAADNKRSFLRVLVEPFVGSLFTDCCQNNIS